MICTRYCSQQSSSLLLSLTLYSLFKCHQRESGSRKGWVLLKANLKMGVSRKQSTRNFPKNEYFLPLDTHTYVRVSGGKKYSFFGKLGMLYFLETSVLRFALLPNYRQFQFTSSMLNWKLLQFRWCNWWQLRIVINQFVFFMHELA